MFRPTVCAAVGLVALSTVTTSAAPVCTTDPKGDVSVSYVGRSAAPVDAPHLDLLRLSVTRGTRDIVATFHTAGGPGNGMWSMFFQYRSTYEFHVRAQRNEGLPWATAPDPRLPAQPTLVQVTRWRPDPDDEDRRIGETRQIRGARADFGTPGQVRVVIPLADLGAATPKRGAKAQVTWARARQSPAAAVEFQDYAECR